MGNEGGADAPHPGGGGGGNEAIAIEVDVKERVSLHVLVDRTDGWDGLFRRSIS